MVYRNWRFFLKFRQYCLASLVLGQIPVASVWIEDRGEVRFVTLAYQAFNCCFVDSEFLPLCFKDFQICLHSCDCSFAWDFALQYAYLVQLFLSSCFWLIFLIAWPFHIQFLQSMWFFVIAFCNLSLLKCQLGAPLWLGQLQRVLIDGEIWWMIRAVKFVLQTRQISKYK